MQLTNEQREFLNEVHFAVVATIAPDGLPHQTVMWYVLDSDQLMLSTMYGSLKHKHLQRDPRLSICVEDAYTYLTLTGTVSLDEDPVAARSDYQRLGQRYTNTMNFPRSTTPGEGESRPDLLSRERITLYMTIDNVQGNRMRR